MSKIPEPWATRLVERGFTDRRSTKSSEPSCGALADKLQVNTTTITDAITGKRRPTLGTVAMLTRELGGDVAEWLGFDAIEPYEPPAEADLLTARQRKAVSELIRAIVAEEKEGGGGDAEGPPSLKEAAPGLREQPGNLGKINTRRRRQVGSSSGDADREDAERRR